MARRERPRGALPAVPAAPAVGTPAAGVYDVSTGSAELVRDLRDPKLWTLWLNGVPSSSVHTGDATVLDFEYLRWMADVLDVLPGAPAPLHAVHLGGAACALPRYLEATRPGSRQVVVEVDGELARLAREWFDLPKAPALRIQVGDARERLATRRDASADLVVRDAFAGDRTPDHLTTLEFTADVARVLRPGGVYLANVADRPPLTLLRAEIATVRSVFPHTAMIAETALLRGRRYANAVLVGSTAPLPLTALSRRVAAGSVAARLVADDDLANLAGSSRARIDPSTAAEVDGG